MAFSFGVQGLTMRICEEGPRLILNLGTTQIYLSVHSLTGVVEVSSTGLCGVLGGKYCTVHEIFMSALTRVNGSGSKCLL